MISQSFLILILVVVVSVSMGKVTAAITSTENEHEIQRMYGTEVSWPMQYHHPDPTRSEMASNTRYIEYMNGCYEKYSVSICNELEDIRIQKNLQQPKNVYKNYTAVGFTKRKSPTDVYTILREYWDRYSSSYLQYEYSQQQQHQDGGKETINIYTNHWVAPTKVLYINPPQPLLVLSSSSSSSQQQIPRMSRVQQQIIIDQVQPIVEQWANTSLRLVQLYGIRAYTNHSIIVPHIDRYPYIISVIINVAQQSIQQDRINDWILEMIGHDGIANNVTMEPGDMILYESHSILHGRPYPLLNQQYYANCFLHFEPIQYHYNDPVTERKLQGTTTTKMKFEDACGKLIQQRQQKSIVSHDTAVTDTTNMQEPVTSSSSTTTAKLNRKVPNYILESKNIEIQRRYKQEFEFHRISLTSANLDDDNDADDMFPKVMYHNAQTGETITLSGNKHKKSNSKDDNNAHVLAARNDIARLREIGRRNPKAITEPDKNGWLPLHEAARGGSTECIKYIVEEFGTTDINARTNDGNGGTALWLAENMLPQDHEVIFILRRNGAISIPPNLKKKNSNKKKEK